jgi:hypothetical protein|tara:strand:+ start:388 stop:687 length:300 start_codon:yes stop_codon:yes gene_type:complete
MRFYYTDHARENLIERKIRKEIVEETVLNPEEVFDDKKSRKIAQRIFGNRLLRVVYKEDNKNPIVRFAHFAASCGVFLTSNLCAPTSEQAPGVLTQLKE